jgi:hypothetical protein
MKLVALAMNTQYVDPEVLHAAHTEACVVVAIVYLQHLPVVATQLTLEDLALSLERWMVLKAYSVVVDKGLV